MLLKHGKIILALIEMHFLLIHLFRSPFCCLLLLIPLTYLMDTVDWVYTSDLEKCINIGLVSFGPLFPWSLTS